MIKPEQDYFAHLRAGRLMLLRAVGNGGHVFHPRIAQPVTGDRDLAWVEASGLGVVHATTVVRPRPPLAPYNVALIDLAEGPRMMSRVEGVPPEHVRIGMAVRARIAVEAEDPILLFDVIRDDDEAAA